MCADGLRLSQAFRDAEASFNDVQDSLHRQIGVLARADYLALSRRVDQAWGNLQRIRAAMDKHFREHSCRTATA